jgi:hypothetical protein
LKNHVQFHHWCIGRESHFENNVYSKRNKNMKNWKFLFHSLSETKQLLGHSHIHALKMDIEGFEWEIIQKDIIDNENSMDLPDQLILELHAMGANRKYVPKHLTQEKSRKKVNEIVLALWKKGYRCVFKLINLGDHHCADVTFLRVLKD